MEQKIKLVVLDGHASNPGDLSWEPIRSQVDEFVCYERTEPEETIGRIGTAQAICTNKVAITREVLEACPDLSYVGVLATGYNQVDLEAAREHGVVVTNIPNYSTDSVAQFTFALLLELCHRISYHHDQLLQGRGQGMTDFCFWDYPQIELRGKTFGVIGYGAIGQRVAKIAQVLGMDVLVYTPHPKPELAGEGISFCSFEALLAESDVISFHCPLTVENQGLLCKETLALCKPGVLILNTARGGLVVEADLAEALRDGKVGGVAADVVIHEPPTQETCPLLGLEHCILTPHLAWASVEARQRLMSVAAKNLYYWTKGNPINQVN